MNEKIIAFYLPQFHPTPENDEWWGKGFTEWTNVAKAKPLFHGHKQPKIPADLGFYDLRLPEARTAQAEIASQYGIHGFCYYHYWFGGDRILEKPFNDVLASGEPDFPFCLCWANHSWSNIWQGTADKMLIEQVYPGMEDHENHFNYLLSAFKDKRYIKVDGKPLFLIYMPDDIPDIKKVVEFWRELALKAGLKGLHLVGVSQRKEQWDPRDRGLDACTMPSLPIRNQTIPRKYFFTKLKFWLKGNKQRLTIFDYKDVMPILLRQNKVDFLDYPTIIPNWDNTPRSGENGLVIQNSTPELFRTHLKQAIDRVSDLPEDNKIIFLKAWNEWAEGNYIEPDLEFGTKYLKVVQDEIQRKNKTSQ